MHPRAIKLNELFSVNDFMATYDRSEGLGLPRPGEINLSTNSYTIYFAYEPSMDRPNVCKASDYAMRIVGALCSTIRFHCCDKLQILMTVLILAMLT